MMWSSIANLKENLNKIALDVHEDDHYDFQIHTASNGDDASFSDRRNSHRFAHSTSVSTSPMENGINMMYNPEVENYKTEIKRLQDSEAEIKALSMNYAALLKDKEDQISRLNHSNSSLRKNLDETHAAWNASRSESSKASSNSSNTSKGSGDPSSANRQSKIVTQGRSRYSGKQMQNGVSPKLDGVSNGITHADQNKMSSSQRNKMEIEDLEAAQATHEFQIKQLRMELKKEHDELITSRLQLQEEQKLRGTLQDELTSLKVDYDKTSSEMSKMSNLLNEKLSEIKRLQIELQRQDNDGAADAMESLRGVIASLEKENADIKIEKKELEAALEFSGKHSTEKAPLGDIEDHLDEKRESRGFFSEKKEMEQSLQNLEKDLKEMRGQRDKALQQLSRLKQHLLEKENEDSEKMDEDSKIIKELRENVEYQRTQILRLEKALKQAIACQEEVKMSNSHEIQKSKDVINDLNKKLGNCMNIIDAKNVELFNLQTALGQYYAEFEAKERLERDLALEKVESIKLAGLLKETEQSVEVLRREKEENLAKLSQSDRLLAEGKNRVNKLEEDNSKLRRALEQSMTSLNRMSIDSDYLVDRRIVIKLLVTYFQRNYSKEVLDLMVRMLGFSEEDKTRINMALRGEGKGVVRGVLGLPGRLVGGILGGGSPADVHDSRASENQSFADMWVDFLLKETVERERRELLENTGRPTEDYHGRSPPPPTAGRSSPIVSDDGANTAGMSSYLSKSSLSPAQNTKHVSDIRGNIQVSENNSDSEFSTVPLTSGDGTTSNISRQQHPRYPK